MSHLETFATAVQINEQDISKSNLSYNYKDEKTQKQQQDKIMQDISKYYNDVIAFYVEQLDDKQQKQLKLNENDSIEQDDVKEINIHTQQSTDLLSNLLDKLPKSRFDDITVSQTVVQDPVKEKPNQVILHCNYDYELQLKEHENTIISLLKELKNAQKIISSKDAAYNKLLEQQSQNEKIIIQQTMEIKILKERLTYTDAIIQKFNLLNNNQDIIEQNKQITDLKEENLELKQKINIYQQQLLNQQLQNKLNGVKNIKIDEKGCDYDILLNQLKINSPYYNFITRETSKKSQHIELQNNGYFHSCEQIKHKVQNEVASLAKKD